MGHHKQGYQTEYPSFLTKTPLTSEDDVTTSIESTGTHSTKLVARARAAAEAFVARHRDGLARLLQDDILCVAVDQAPRGAPTLL